MKGLREEWGWSQEKIGVAIKIDESAPKVATRATAKKLTPHQSDQPNFEHGQREWDLYVTLSVDFCEYVVYRSHCGHR